MLFGHNTNVSVSGTIFHVQTEDRGIATGILETTVYCHGRVLHRRTIKYLDLLPLDPDRQEALRIRLDDQHATVVEELKSGALHVEPQAPPQTPSAVSPPRVIAPALVSGPSIGSAGISAGSVAGNSITVELLNPRTWLTGKNAKLYIVARYRDGAAPASAARIVARVDSGAESTEAATVAAADGHANLEFIVPWLGGEDAALVIEAVVGDARGQLRFQLRAKPKAPAAE